VLEPGCADIDVAALHAAYLSKFGRLGGKVATDAKLEREALGARAYSHVEATTGKDCVRVHTSACALCQHLTTPIAKADKPAPPQCASRAAMPAVAFWVPRVVADTERPTLPRAPPAF